MTRLDDIPRTEASPPTRRRCEDAPPNEPPLYHVNIVSNEPLLAEFKVAGAKVLEYMRSVEQCGWLSNMEGASVSVLFALLVRTNGELLQANGKLLAWPTNGKLQKMTGYGRSVTYAATSQLEKMGCLSRARIDWRGTIYLGWELLDPPEHDERDARTVRPAGRGRALGRKKSPAGRTEARARPDKNSGPPDGGARSAGQGRALGRTVLSGGPDSSLSSIKNELNDDDEQRIHVVVGLLRGRKFAGGEFDEDDVTHLATRNRWSVQRVADAIAVFDDDVAAKKKIGAPKPYLLALIRNGARLLTAEQRRDASIPESVRERSRRDAERAAADARKVKRDAERIVEAQKFNAGLSAEKRNILIEKALAETPENVRAYHARVFARVPISGNLLVQLLDIAERENGNPDIDTEESKT